MPPVSGIDADSSANASAPHSTMMPPSIQTPIISIGIGHARGDAGRECGRCRRQW